MSTLSTYSQAQAAALLGRLGLRARTTGEYTQSVRVFQDTWRLGERLKVDGIVGPKTSDALGLSEARRQGGHSTCSEHFSYSEFACQCRCSYDTCRGVWVLGALIDGLEAIRARYYTDGLHVVSGYRCPDRNRAIGGAADSQHMHGAAADIAQRQKPAAITRLGAVSGVGYRRANGLVCHVDVRHASESNPTGSTRARPAVFVDG